MLCNGLTAIFYPHKQKAELDLWCMCKDPNVGIKQIPLKAEIPAHTPSLVDSSKKPGKHRFHHHLVHLIFTATKQSYKIIVSDIAVL